MTKTKDNSMAIILTLSLATLVGCMNMGLFNVALPALMVYFNTDVTTIQWISSGFTLAAGVITPVVGFMGDKFSYKKTLITVSFLTLVLTVVGIFSWCIEALIVVRILFGLTAGMATEYGHVVSECAKKPAGQSCRHLGYCKPGRRSDSKCTGRDYC